MPQQDPWRLPTTCRHVQAMLDSYARWLGHDLIPRPGTAVEQSQSLFDAPLVVAAHDAKPDPLLCYGNRRALALWETDWESWLQTPSRLTAEAAMRPDRIDALARVRRDGYICDYQGQRITRTGRKFSIAAAVVWNVIDQAGNYLGQGVAFSTWKAIDDGVWFPDSSR